MAHLPDGKYLVWTVAVACTALVLLAGWRIIWGQDKAQELCEKLDKVFVALEVRTQESDNLTAAQKKQALALYESFRSEPPVCRTSPSR